MTKQTQLTSKHWLEFCKKIFQGVSYDENVHCPLILEIFDDGGGMSEFYVKVGVSAQRVGHWMRDHPEFFEIVQLAKEIGKQHWLREGETNIENKDFNRPLWAVIGKRKFGATEKLALHMHHTSSPMEQYRQIISQASSGDFTAPELKQIMEAINIGLRAHEVCELQSEIDELKEGLKKMEERELEHQVSNQGTPEKDKATLGGGDGEPGGSQD